MMKFLLAGLFYIVCFNATCQGYYGKKNYIKAEALATFPNLWYNFFKSEGASSVYNRQMEAKKDRLNYGFHFSLYRILKKNVAFGVEAGVDYSDIYLPIRSIFLVEPTYSMVKVENIQISKIGVTSYSFMPKIEFSSIDAILPMGFTQEIGVGVSYSNVVDQDYKFNYSAMTITDDTSGVVTEEYIREHLINYNVFSVQSYTFLYGLNLKIPIAKCLLLNYGFRYTLNTRAFFSPLNEEREVSDFLYSSGEINESIRQQRTRSVFNFSLGLTLVF